LLREMNVIGMSALEKVLAGHPRLFSVVDLSLWATAPAWAVRGWWERLAG
jgi:hypothetical protein